MKSRKRQQPVFEPSRIAPEWEAIFWTRIIKNVFSLQRRIDNATCAGQFHKARALQRMLDHSLGAKALAAMEEIEQENRMQGA